MKQRHWLFGLLGVAGLLVHAFSAQQATAAENPMAVAAGPSLRWVKAKAAKAGAKDEVTGSLSPSKMLPLGFEVGGRLAKLYVQKGQTVKAGQALAQLDTEIAEAQVAQAQAAVAAAEAGSLMATDMAERNTKLQAEGSISDVQNRGAQTQSKQAEAQFLAAKAQLAQATAARRKHDIRAPFAGLLVDAPEQIGGMVGPGLPVFVLQQMDPLTLKTTVTETSRAALKVGSKVRVTAVASGASTEEAVLKLVIPSADPATRRIPVEISVPNADTRFIANTLARAVLPLGEVKSAYAIPATALATSGGDHVWTASSSGLLKKVLVAVVERRSNEVLVSSPEALEQVVDYPTSSLTEGTSVSQMGPSK